jgi:hypothetical protein
MTTDPDHTIRCAGRIRALSTLSPVRPERLGALHRRLWVVQWVPGLGRPLLELGTIHYARWTVVSSLPAPDGSGAPWWLNWSYLLFEASYDGDEREYLDTFSDVLPLRISEVFGGCVGFEEEVESVPAARGRVLAPGAFRRFVDRNRLDVAHFYAAAPDHDVGAIRQALSIERVERRSDRLQGAALRRVGGQIEGMALGPPPEAPGVRDGVVSPWLRKVGRRLGVSPLTILAPLNEGGWDHVEGLEDPFAGLADTHFARLARVPRDMQEQIGQRHPDVLECDYLLFTCDHDGDQGDYVEMLWSADDGARARAIFGKCPGFRDVSDRRGFHRWVRRHLVPTKYYVWGYPPHPAAQVRKATEVRARVGEWATTQPLSAGARKST